MWPEILDKIITLVSVIIGGLLSYWANNKVNEKIMKRKAIIES